MDSVRVRRVDGESLVCDHTNSKPEEGTIGTEEGWKSFLASLPRHSGRGKPIALVAHSEDLEFRYPQNAHHFLGYTFEEAVRRMERDLPRLPASKIPFSPTAGRNY